MSTVSSDAARALDEREALIALVRAAPIHIGGDASDMLLDGEDNPAECASSELDALLSEHPYDDEPGKKKYTEHAEHLARVAVLILHSALAWMERAKPKKRAPKPPDPQAPLFPGGGK